MDSSNGLECRWFPMLVPPRLYLTLSNEQRGQSKAQELGLKLHWLQNNSYTNIMITADTTGDAMNPTALIPRQEVPALDLPLTTGGRYVGGRSPGERFDLLVFYRGLHCPICAKYLLELERLGEEFQKRGVRIVAISSDELTRASEMADKVSAHHIQVAYGLDLTMARRWGLYISTSKGKTSIGLEEPPLFSEPGVFLVKPDQTLYYGSTQTMPFARPSFGDLLAAVDFAIQKDYPARGEYTGDL